MLNRGDITNNLKLTLIECNLMRKFDASTAVQLSARYRMGKYTRHVPYVSPDKAPGVVRGSM
jgi:hypothetical protein